MRVGNYSLLIPEGRERDSGHVELAHGKQYTLQIKSHDHRRCDAEVTIDGKVIGTFRIYANAGIVLERSPDDNGRFTFYAAESAEAEAAGRAKIDTSSLGLIQVRFVPEKRVEHGGVVKSHGLLRSVEPACFAGAESLGRGIGPIGLTAQNKPGMTGLSGHSDQRFTNVADLDLDESGAVTISLRLVTGVAGPHELKPARRGNPVPEPVV